MRAEKTYSANTQNLDVPPDGTVNAKITVSGAFTATLTFQISRDGGATFDTCACTNAAGAIVTTATAAGVFYAVNRRPTDIIRVATTAYTSGSPKAVVETM